MLMRTLNALVHRLSKAGVDGLRPAKQNHPARSPLANCSTCMARLVAFPLLVLHTYEKPHCAINAFWVFVVTVKIRS